ncbi:MAG: hypothetical protein ACQESY_09975 [Pseudomonadota bacterium]
MFIRPALKQLLINKCPVIAPTSTLTGEAAKRLNIDIMKSRQHRQTLLNQRKTIQQKLARIFEQRPFEPVEDPDLMIYAGGFFDDKDKALMQRIHDTSPEELGTQTWSFADKRLPEMLFRYRARNYPETLTADEQAQWLEHCQARLIKGESGHLTFQDFFGEIEQLRTEMAGDNHKAGLLDEVESFGQQLQGYLQS